MAKKKKLLFFIEDSNLGGSEKSIVSLLQSLDYSRVDVDLMLVVGGGTLIDAVPPQVRIVDYPRPGGLLYRLGSLLYSARWRYHERRGIRRHKAETLWSSVGMAIGKVKEHYDVAVAYHQGFPTYFVATHVDADMKVAWINTDMEGAGYRERYNSRYYRRYQWVVAVSEELYAKLRDSGYTRPGQLTTIYDIVNEEVVRTLARKEHPLPQGQGINIVTVGRVEPPKNYPLAIETARALHDAGLEFTWTIVGSGSMLGHIRQMARDLGVESHMRYAGLQTNPYPYIADCDIYVQTSRVEGFCLTVSEAKILHKPIVSTNFPVIHDQITDGVNGLIAEMTPEALAGKIMSLAGDETLRRRLSEALEMEHNTTARTETEKFYRIIGLQ